MQDLFLSAAIEAAHAAGTILMENFGKVQPSDIREKSAVDFISYVDESSEKKIIEILRSHFPDHAFLAEESGETISASPYRWIIDPLDGTTNYLHVIPFFAVSIALEYEEEIIVGVVYNPIINELFYAQKNKGAFLNKNRIHVSNAESLAQSFIATGFPFKKKHVLSKHLKAFEKIFLKCIGARRIGSAALDLSYIACGRFDGFWEIGLQPWDIAAGTLIVREAGGAVTDFWDNHSCRDSQYIIATNNKVHVELGEIIRGEFPVYKNLNKEDNA